MPKTIEVLNPVAEVARLELTIAPRLESLNGKTVGLLDNSKPNFDIFLDRVAELIQERFQQVKIIRAQKALAGVPFPADRMAKFAAECDAVINGMSD